MLVQDENEACVASSTYLRPQPRLREHVAVGQLNANLAFWDSLDGKTDSLPAKMARTR